jgi:hypothetical protein
VVVVRSVREVEACRVHAGGDERVEPFGVEHDGPMVATILVRLGLTEAMWGM